MAKAKHCDKLYLWEGWASQNYGSPFLPVLMIRIFLRRVFLKLPDCKPELKDIHPSVPAWRDSVCHQAQLLQGGIPGEACLITVTKTPVRILLQHVWFWRSRVCGFPTQALAP